MSFDMKKVGWTACKNEHCKYGNKCTFRHGGETRDECVARVTEAQKTKVVKTEDKRWTVVCENWKEHGVCPYKNRCHFAHCKKHELNTYREAMLALEEVIKNNKFTSFAEAEAFNKAVETVAANFGEVDMFYFRWADELDEFSFMGAGLKNVDKWVLDPINKFGFCTFTTDVQTMFTADAITTKLVFSRWVNKATKAKHELKEFVETAVEADDVDEIAHAVLAEAAGEVPEEDLTDEEEEALDKALGFTEEEFDGDTEFALKVLAGMDPEQSEVLMTAIQTIATEFAAAVEVA